MTKVVFSLFTILLCLTQASLLAAQPLEVRALLVPEEEAVLSSRIKAQIIKLHVQEGDRFQQGDPLIELDCDILRAELEKAKMDLEAAIETHGANLRLKQYGSGSDLEVALSSAKRKRAQAQVLLVETKVGMCLVAAPFDGRVVSRKANAHEAITPDDKLLEIINDRKLKLHILVPSHWLRWLKVGKALVVRLDETGKKYKAQVTGLGARVNPVNQTLEVEAAIEGEHPELLAGMSGTATFQAKGGK